MKNFSLFKNFVRKNGTIPTPIDGYVVGETEETTAEMLGLKVKVSRTVDFEAVNGWKKNKNAQTVYYLRETIHPEGDIIEKI